MCGISGLIWKDVQRPAGREQLRMMNHVQYHRGPDDGGEYYDGPVALGQRRLSIIDLSDGGHQPMVSDDGRLVVTYNGEIYNYVELREELIGFGHKFRSDSDTEVLLKAYEHWGTDCVNRFNGMWAFAVYDKTEQRVFFSRDRFGIKPLYFVNDGQRFVFASEIKGLLAPFPDLRVVNDAFMHYFLPSGALDDGPETVFQKVQLLLPAHNGVYDINSGTMRIERFWDVEPEAFEERWVGNDPIQSLRYLLESSVQLHMRSDVPVGTCLSGGVDSSTLVCLMSELRDDPVHTFSGLYKDKECNEEEFVEAIRDHTQCHGADIRREPNGDFVDDIATITWHQDMPTAGPGLYTQFNVMMRASDDVRVILDGQGGDELFAGYVPYYRLRVNDLLNKGTTSSVAEAYYLMGTVGRHWGMEWLAGVDASSLLNRIRRGVTRVRNRIRPDQPDPIEPPFFHQSLTDRVAGQEILRSQPEKYPDTLSQTLFRHLVDQSIPALLHYEDRNSMAFSLEARVPLLDYRIVEFALGLCASYKIRGSWTKWILRKAAEEELPSKVAWRRSKMGYPTPAARWMRQKKDRDGLSDVLFSKRFLDREIVSRDSLDYYWKQHQSGKVDRSWLLYRYATTELWYQHFVDAFIPKTARPAPEETHDARSAAE